MLFYSRRIGLDQGRQIPIEAGGRLTGRVGGYSVGLINIQTDDDPHGRVRSRPIFRWCGSGATSCGGARSARSSRAARRRRGGAGAGETFGVDGIVRVLYQPSGSTHTGRGRRRRACCGDDTAIAGGSTTTPIGTALQLEHLVVGDELQSGSRLPRGAPTSGRAGPRCGSARARGQARWCGRYWFQASGEYFENSAGLKETRELLGEFCVDFQNSDRVEITYQDKFELIPRPFRIAPGVSRCRPAGTSSGRSAASSPSASSASCRAPCSPSRGRSTTATGPRSATAPCA